MNPDELNEPDCAPAAPGTPDGEQQQQDAGSPAPVLEADVSPPRGLPFPVVGIGASAGGLEAIMQLLRALPANTGMAFVIVQHLDPHYESQLTDLLREATQMPVQTVEDGMPVQPGRVSSPPMRTWSCRTVNYGSASGSPACTCPLIPSSSP